ncbi:PTS transporter subunit EIIC [Escherichia coli]
MGGIMISAALTSFLTGITEPIEFYSSCSLRRILYIIHAILAGASQSVFFWGCVRRCIILARSDRLHRSVW